MLKERLSILKEKEEYIAVCRKHWAFYICPCIGGGIFLLCALLFLLMLEFTAFLVCLGFAVFYLVYAFVVYKTEYIALTETKIIGHKGFIRTQTLSSPISKVQNVSLSNGLLGKIFHYHTIKIDNAGTGKAEFTFNNMAHAEEFISAVYEKIQ